MREVSTIRVRGPLAGLSPGLIELMVRERYRPATISARLELMASLSSWMAKQGLTATDLNEAVIVRILKGRQNAGHSRWLRPSMFRFLLAYLRSVGVTLPATVVVVPPSAVDLLFVRYRSYLLDDLGLAESTVKNYVLTGRLFMTVACGGDVDRIAGLTVTDVTGYVIGLSKRGWGAATVTTNVCGVRALLRWFWATEQTRTPLARSAPWLARARMSSLPRTLAPGVAQRLLASCDRATTFGTRDYALLILFCRLGLRVGEVVAIELDDLNWQRSELLVRSKGGWRDPLPIPVDVGEALAAYLQQRGPSEHRRLFLKMVPPYRALSDQAVKAVVRRACARIDIPVLSTHCLRHSVASDLLREGASLPEIGQVLRHREVATTSIYARVDHAALASVTQPWPGLS